MLKVYSRPDCMYCTMTKHLLERYEIPFSLIDVSQQTTSRQFLLEAGHKSVPQIYHKGELFCDGYTELAEMTKEDIENKIKDQS